MPPAVLSGLPANIIPVPELGHEQVLPGLSELAGCTHARGSRCTDLPAADAITRLHPRVLLLDLHASLPAHDLHVPGLRRRAMH